MKKQIISAAAALTLALSFTAANAEEYTLLANGNSRAVLMCYDNGVLQRSCLLKENGGVFKADTKQFDVSQSRIYYVDTQEYYLLEDVATEPAPIPAETDAPSATEEPAASAKPAGATPSPTAAPSSSSSVTVDKDLSGTPYEKQVDAVYAPALVTDVESGTNASDDDVYYVTMYYRGKEIKVEVEDDITISSAPSAYSYTVGSDMSALEKGDVVVMTASIAGDVIRSVDLITRPASEDIVTGDTDYGSNFERLFASGVKVANKWTYLKYGEKHSSDKYTYAYGIVGKMQNGTLTLLAADGVTDNALEIDIDPNAYVYTCSVSGKEYETEIGSRSDISSTLPSNLFRDDVIELDDGYSYNYALVRMVDDTATDVIVYTDYND